MVWGDEWRGHCSPVSLCSTHADSGSAEPSLLCAKDYTADPTTALQQASCGLPEVSTMIFSCYR